MQQTLIIIGLMSLFFAFTSLQSWLKDRKRSLVSVTGTVVELQRKEVQGAVTFASVYEYTYEGLSYRETYQAATGKFSSKISAVAAASYPVGSEIPLLVDEKDPSYARVDDGTKSMTPLTAVIFLGIALFCAVRILMQ